MPTTLITIRVCLNLLHFLRFNNLAIIRFDNKDFRFPDSGSISLPPLSRPDSPQRRLANKFSRLALATHDGRGNLLGGAGDWSTSLDHPQPSWILPKHWLPLDTATTNLILARRWKTVWIMANPTGYANSWSQHCDYPTGCANLASVTSRNVKGLLKWICCDWLLVRGGVIIVALRILKPVWIVICAMWWFL